MPARSIASGLPGASVVLSGNQALARGCLEAGVAFCTSYPGSPSVEVAQSLFDVGADFGMYGEWSVNEMVALEAAAAASFAGLRAVCVMKQNGLAVASDFLLSLNYSGTRGGLVIVVGDDPSAHSSINEVDSRHLARMAELPLVEPTSIHEAKEMAAWAFDVSEELGLPVILRTVTRICHSRGNVTLGHIRSKRATPGFGPEDRFVCMPPGHPRLHQRVETARELFEKSPFNSYWGPEGAGTVLVAGGTGWLYAREAVEALGLESEVGILKLGTLWPLPRRLILGHLATARRVVVVEETDPFLEQGLKSLATEGLSRVVEFWGQTEGKVVASRGVGIGEISPDVVLEALRPLTGRPCSEVHQDSGGGTGATGRLPGRELAMCPGCPHRSSFWALKAALALDGRGGFVVGDIGCYTMAVWRTGFNMLQTVHSMGSGIGLANGFGQLHRFGFQRPVVAVMGDSTFFHACIPALVNALYNGANLLAVVLDNEATAMTGFQPHPGTGLGAMGQDASRVRIEAVCQGLGLKVEVADPFDFPAATHAAYELLQQSGAKVLVLRQRCALVADKARRRVLYVVDQEKCIGDACGCARFCSRVFGCPANLFDESKGKAYIDEVTCNGCGVCGDLCPRGAIHPADGRA